MNIPREIEDYIIDMTIGGQIEKEVDLIQHRISSLPRTRYHLTRAGIEMAGRDEPVWHFKMSDTDPLLPIFNEYVRQLSPLLA